jgi:hypothetical protein
MYVNLFFGFSGSFGGDFVWLGDLLALVHSGRWFRR